MEEQRYTNFISTVLYINNLYNFGLYDKVSFHNFTELAYIHKEHSKDL